MSTRFALSLTASCLLPAAVVMAADGWIELVGEGGATGFQKIGDGLRQCGDVSIGAGKNELQHSAGSGVIASLGKNRSGKGNLVTEQTFGDCEVELEFLLARGSNSGIKMQWMYEVQLYDSHGKEHPTGTDCGGIYPHWVFKTVPGKGLKYLDDGVPPRTNAAKPAGEWQTLRIEFVAPRFDAAGEKIANARFEQVVLNGELIHEGVELDSPTGNVSTPRQEKSMGPLFLQMDHGAVAFRNVRLRPLGGEAQ